ncbi:ABC-type nitrate/sulfonate/bicarbonate transport system permease component [Paenibacillus brasilensis]|uniref:ABC-type nitrate/sulfonate/bicarbonate transport system permease component n=1 Tax=Paenibacillus brasilensis TaxID=128574 RepID=A0ABU0L365_9BACL|nr:ABC-type nitrate/sulfonate/bicarbonate transport system permease component [Paenibacillus brasilensis]
MEEMAANPAVETAAGIRASKKGTARSGYLAGENQVLGLLKKILPPLVVFVLFIGGWEMVVRMLGMPPYILPKPSDIAAAAADNSTNLITSVSTTIVEALIGFAISVVLGISLAILLRCPKRWKKAYIRTPLFCKLFWS